MFGLWIKGGGKVNQNIDQSNLNSHLDLPPPILDFARLSDQRHRCSPTLIHSLDLLTDECSCGPVCKSYWMPQADFMRTLHKQAKPRSTTAKPTCTSTPSNRHAVWNPITYISTAILSFDYSLLTRVAEKEASEKANRQSIPTSTLLDLCTSHSHTTLLVRRLSITIFKYRLLVPNAEDKFGLCSCK